MGSRSKIDLAYIAGFLDGDGSLMLQLKKRKDGKAKIRFMLTICFYQDTRHEKPLYWIRNILGIGYISRRNDGMTELRINGYKQVRNIIKDLLPYIRFKKYQAKALFEASDILCRGNINKLNKNELKTLVNLILVIQKENYVTKKKKTKEELYKILDLTP
ncbi:MAG: hypothetical protein A3H63_00340 [Candidatus Harrisonbacteria bacterium RIFCSPLOWO2_02_FULL_45_10c]|uniref:Homing endonuclease LAGLIDADG domain-containing protein n=1 Tax=Candidatus Harrisonbacteria bacterium RIFCSPLOWO2_02_FULL_45_10c TaxID=1798410 RepID=A0A1G1ZUL0_9BACT|nr:MAG: hypothetical protein A3H63_00340 [Candidatus Harrisonbacteria bacterium RIFCSPLOWO2_02_FULL_45_10c]